VREGNLVTVGWAYGQAEAGLAMALLGSAGIRVFADTWYLASMNWTLTHAFGGIALQVPASEAKEAAAILAEFPIARRPRPWSRRLLGGAVMLAVFLTLGFPPPPYGLHARRLRPAVSRALESAASPG